MRGVLVRVGRRASDAGHGAQTARVLNLKEDREVHHGEEEKGEETIDQKEEGRSGPQEAQNDEGLSEAVDQEEISAQSCPEAPFGAEACSVDACRGTGADALVEPAQRLRRRWRRRRSLATAQGQKNAAAPGAAACIA